MLTFRVRGLSDWPGTHISIYVVPDTVLKQPYVTARIPTRDFEKLNYTVDK